MMRKNNSFKLFAFLLSICIFMNLNMNDCTGFVADNQFDGQIYKIDKKYNNFPWESSHITHNDDTDNIRAQTQLQLTAEQWISRYNRLGNSGDEASALAVDTSGNIYVTGHSVGIGTSLDYVTIKYDPAGNEQWIARYNGPIDGQDEASTLAVDISGNVYVTGRSQGSGTYTDCVTIKYDPAGNEQWIARYNGPGNLFDEASALAVDVSGNVYVTGRSQGSGTSMDYVTIKYDPAGNEQWIVRYNGPGNDNDGATALTVDASGYVYVTGYSKGSGTFDDYTTIKYDPAGNEQWIAWYNGPGNGPDGASALAVDVSGNVYVTGYSTSSETLDYVTIRYDLAGNEQWIARYNGPENGNDYAHALAVDASGNVYVTGHSVGSGMDWDYATIKYDQLGIEQWSTRYNGPGNSGDEASALAVDTLGNVYVTGYSEGSGTFNDYATIKYDPAGNEQWIVRYNGPENSYDQASALAIDTSGNVYVTGFSVGIGMDADYITIKYNPPGNEQWIARYNGPEYGWDEASALAVDVSGNVYVTGFSVSSGTDADYVTIKYDPVGNEQWIAWYNGPGSGWDEASALAVDASGNVYVTGHSEGSGTFGDYDYATIKYDPAGNEQWITRYNGPGSGWDAASALAVDTSGNVYVTGYSEGSGTYTDYVTIKYDPAGNEQWRAWYNGPGNGWDAASALAVDTSGNVYVTGGSEGSGTFGDCATIKYSPAGNEQWIARYNGPENGYDGASALAIDASGNVYVTGYSVGSGTDRDYATIKYDPAGNEHWIARYNGPENSNDEPSAMVVDASGNVYVTGFSVVSGADRDYATIKYNSVGNEQWIARYNGPGNGYDQASALAVDASGNVYVTGRSEGSGTLSDYATIKYVQILNFYWIFEPVDQILKYGEALDYQLAVVNELVPNWWINDTDNFDLEVNYYLGSSSCHIRNKTFLLPGKYGIEIVVSDFDGNTISGEFTVIVEPSSIANQLELKLSGSFDYLEKEKIHLQLAGLLTEKFSGEPVMGATISFTIYNPDGIEIYKDYLLENSLSSGVYVFKHPLTIDQEKNVLHKGIYWVYAHATTEDGLETVDMIQFHIDPPSETPVSMPAWFFPSLIGVVILLCVSVGGFFLKRRF